MSTSTSPLATPFPDLPAVAGAMLRVARAVESDYEVSAALSRNLWATGNFLAPSYAARPWRLWRANKMRRVDGIDGPANWDVAAP